MVLVSATVALLKLSHVGGGRSPDALGGWRPWNGGGKWRLGVAPTVVHFLSVWLTPPRANGCRSRSDWRRWRWWHVAAAIRGGSTRLNEIEGGQYVKTFPIPFPQSAPAPLYHIGHHQNYQTDVTYVKCKESALRVNLKWFEVWPKPAAHHRK